MSAMKSKEYKDDSHNDRIYLIRIAYQHFHCFNAYIGFTLTSKLPQNRALGVC